MVTAKKKKETRIKKRNIFLLIMLLTMSLGALYIINGTNILLPKINEATASYITFNNSNTTDMIKITNIKKYNKKTAKSVLNKNEVYFEVDGKIDDEFSIVIYSIGNKIEKKYINYLLFENDNEIKQGKLSTCEEKNNGGIIIYHGKIKKDSKYKIKMWIDTAYEKTVNNISYEVKIQSR